MTKINQNLPGENDEFISGDTAIITDTVVQSDGSGKNLTNTTIYFALAEYRGGEVYVSKDSNGSDVTVTDAQGGIVEVELVPDDTSDLGAPSGETYYYEIEVEDDTGQNATVTTGTFEIYVDTV